MITRGYKWDDVGFISGFDVRPFFPETLNNLSQM
jgi:hypothetical protein